MKRLLAVALVWSALLALSPAPIKDMQHGKLEREKSEAQRTTEQTGARMGEVGGVEKVVDGAIAPAIEPANDASAVISASASSKSGADAVKTASEGIEKQKSSGGFNWIAALMVACGAFGVFQVFRMWANKNLPEPGQFR